MSACNGDIVQDETTYRLILLIKIVDIAIENLDK